MILSLVKMFVFFIVFFVCCVFVGAFAGGNLGVAACVNGVIVAVSDGFFSLMLIGRGGFRKMTLAGHRESHHRGSYIDTRLLKWNQTLVAPFHSLTALITERKDKSSIHFHH